VISAGNFHAEPLAMVFDYAAMAVAEIGSISERRTERLVNPDLSGLEPFLADDATKESGYMIVQVTAAALVAENRVLCHPASVDSLPTSAGQEDHVSMGTHAARKLGQVVANATYVVSAELLCAARALESLGELTPGRGTKAAWEAVRDAAPRIPGDHPPAPELEALAELVSSGGLVAAVEEAAGPLEGIAPRKRRSKTSRRKR
ncbi:MAG: aromatic amino acid lyase, partial [Planctomycetota bacterium]